MTEECQSTKPSKLQPFPTASSLLDCDSTFSLTAQVGSWHNFENHSPRLFWETCTSSSWNHLGLLKVLKYPLKQAGMDWFSHRLGFPKDYPNQVKARVSPKKFYLSKECPNYSVLEVFLRVVPQALFSMECLPLKYEEIKEEERYKEWEWLIFFPDSTYPAKRWLTDSFVLQHIFK